MNRPEQPDPTRPDAPPGPPPRGRMIQLDVLRGVAIMLVLFAHQPIPGWMSGKLRPIFETLHHRGGLGVDLFFVLSGFLVGGLLFSELRNTGRIDVRRFLIRRGLKIWPSYYVYWVVLAVVAALFYVDHGIRGAQRAALENNALKLVYLQNYFPANDPPAVPHAMGGHTWSLAVEEHFYLLLPFLVVLLLWLDWRLVPAVIVATIAAVPIYRCLAYRPPWVYYHHYTPTHWRIDTLFLGVLLAYLWHMRPGFAAWVGRWRAVLWVVGLGMVVPLFYVESGVESPVFLPTLGYSVAALGFACLLMAMVTTPEGEGLVGRFLQGRLARALAFIGVWSYSIYLWHAEVMSLFQYLYRSSPLARNPTVVSWFRPIPWTVVWPFGAVIYTVAAIGLGILMSRLIEAPVLALRDRWYPSRVRSAVAVASVSAVPAAAAEEPEGPRPAIVADCPTAT